MDRKQIGKDAENHARTYLERAGLKTLTSNYNCRGGEIDLILRHGKTLVFVEVRLRSNPHFGSAAETVTPSKQKRIIHAARHFLMRNSQLSDLECRFDVIAFDSTEALSAPLWYKDAFRL
ncbi:YraN family protein [Pontibacterium granulatum]|uniref:YraN family protein n=1 Tax=Pontibacterium granulatum TaxID=2036029 RepID=UPI00249BF3E6|nr:YraN family protein [Pontibacterium granulatum]MDI3323647.1 YraN family protein [Pontibacterium granulatum]